MNVHIYPHNDISSLAHHQLKAINDKVRRGDNVGIAIDCMGLIISLAFSVEAIVNFVGHKKVSSWNERDRIDDKFQVLRREIGLPYDRSVEPYKTAYLVRTLRNDMGHAKPLEKDVEISHVDEIRGEMHTTWDEYLTPEQVNLFNMHVKELKQLLLSCSGISVHDSITRAFGPLGKDNDS
jgi:hypothetical protein